MSETKKPQNPSAFPSKLIDHQESAMQSRTVYNGQEEGMTLRDYFAAKAMQGTLSTSNMEYPNSKKELESLCEISYTIADAMLKQRELTEENK